MKRLFIYLSLSFFVPPALAQSSLSNLPAAVSVAGTDLFYIVKTPGVGGVRASAAQIGQFIYPSGTSCPPFSGVPNYSLLANTTSAPTATTLNIFDTSQCVPWATLNQTAHTFGLTPNTVFDLSTPSLAPSSLGLWDSFSDSFTGDNSHISFGNKYQISGVASLGQPTSGYVYTPELTPNVTYLNNLSGWNNSTSTNVGRTAATAYRTYVNQLGQGDAVAFNATCFANAAKTGATIFLANPACTLFNGDTGAGQAGVFLNPFQAQIEDNGFDVAGIGIELELIRTNNTGVLSTFWAAFRAQSSGTQPIDVGFSLTGSVNYGIDLSYANLGSNKAAITLSADQKIYGNVTAGDALDRFPTALNGTYLTYQSANSGWQLVVNNSTSAIFQSGETLLLGTVSMASGSTNGFTVTGAGTGSAPTFVASGGDTNIGFLFGSKGSGVYLFRTEGAGGPTQFSITDTASATDYIQITGSNGGAPTLSTNGGNLSIAPAGGSTTVTGGLNVSGTSILGSGSTNNFTFTGAVTGSAPTFTATGSDTNVGFLFATQGSGVYLFRTEGAGGPTQFLISDTASATNFIQVTGSNGSAPTLSTNGGNLTIAPNGGTTSVTGALTATTTLRANSGFSANGTVGVSTTCTVTASNTYVFTFGLLTTKGANCT